MKALSGPLARVVDAAEAPSLAPLTSKMLLEVVDAEKALFIAPDCALEDKFRRPFHGSILSGRPPRTNFRLG